MCGQMRAHRLCKHITEHFSQQRMERGEGTENPLMHLANTVNLEIPKSFCQTARYFEAVAGNLLLVTDLTLEDGARKAPTAQNHRHPQPLLRFRQQRLWMKKP